MKEGTAYAKRLKQAHAKLLRSAPDLPVPEPDDPLRRLVLAALAVSADEQRAEKALQRLLDAMVDLNEVRVSRPSEVAQLLDGVVPDARARGVQLTRLLQAVFDRENTLSLERVRSMSRRDAKQYLEALDGADEYVVASVMLWSLSAHAIPVNDRLLEELRAADLVHPEASRAEVQAYLERHISAADARVFCLLMRDFDASQTGRKSRGGTGRKKAGGASRGKTKAKRKTGKSKGKSAKGTGSAKRTSSRKGDGSSSGKSDTSRRTAS